MAAAYKPSARSVTLLATCHPDLRRVVEALWSEGVALHVICGHRGKAEQDRAFAEKKSKVRWPDSRHNSVPSEAVDLTPIPLDWNDVEAFDELAKLVIAKADQLGIPIKWGGHFRTLVDRPHFELSQ